ncbi:MULTISPECIES: ABC transporter permease [unclassified Bradyrhizobium]|uniref:ABC transporter permease n=1 Tax=unclassified Bradyrhizobium TaxID=2631580 RepID=UPI001FFC0300
MLLRPPAIATPLARIWNFVFNVLCVAILALLVSPLAVIIPLSFNAEPFFTFTPGMLSAEASAYSLRWYEQVLTDPQWRLAAWNSLFIGVASTALATTLGTWAALGMTQRRLPGHAIIMMLLQAPMMAPIVIVAAAIYFFLVKIGLTQTLTGIVLAHTLLGSPFVVSTIVATLSGFDRNLTRASLSLGASGARTFFKVTLPLIWPGIFSGALLAFVTSLDEVVVVLFLGGGDQRTLPLQMWSGLREQLSPAILAAATMLMALSIILLGVKETLRRRSERLALTNFS